MWHRCLPAALPAGSSREREREAAMRRQLNQPLPASTGGQTTNSRSVAGKFEPKWLQISRSMAEDAEQPLSGRQRETVRKTTLPCGKQRKTVRKTALPRGKRLPLNRSMRFHV